MDKVLNIAEELKKYLYDLPEVKEYFALLKAFEEDESLIKLRNEIINLETNFRNGENTIEEMKRAKFEYENNPLVINYRESHKTIIALLDEIKKIID